MKRHTIHIACLTMLVFSSCQYDLDLRYAELQKVKVGDDIAWSTVDYNDSTWNHFEYYIPGDSVYWVRQKINLRKLQSKKNLVLRVGAIGSYDLYWDGVYVTTNGDPGLDSESEFVEGSYIHIAVLPDSLAGDGDHVISMRSRNPYDHLGQHSFSLVGNYLDVITSPFKISIYMFLVGGVFMVTGLFFLFSFLSSRKDYSALIFGAICLLFLALLLLEYLKLFHLYPYSFQRARLVYIGYVHVCLSLLIPAFFTIQFKFPYWKWLFAVIIGIILFLEIWHFERFDWLAKKQNTLMWVASLLTILYACGQRQKEGLIVLAGFIASMMVLWLTPLIDLPYVSSFDISLFLSFLCIIFSMLYIMTYRRKQERLAYEESLVVSERLKNELLKKNIKPHFIMNTLTTLIDWVEEAPEQGVELIHSLASEFEVLNDIADHKLVPIGQEIKLCKTHLKVMSYRKEINYTWEQEGIDENEVVPPAILHTLVENGVTHSKSQTGSEIVFRLTFSKKGSSKKYQLLVSDMESDQVATPAYDGNEGTGTKYINSRLQESYGDQWSFESGPVSDGWLSTINIYT